MDWRENLKKVKPQSKSESDKYSANLYKVLKKIEKEYNLHEKEIGNKLKNQVRFYFAHRHIGWDDKHIEWSEDLYETFWIPNSIVVSPFGKNSGYFLSSILREGGRSELFYTGSILKNNTDITEWFWDKYISIGRCLFDYKHNQWMIGDNDRFHNINSNNKKCKWCGKHFHREVVKTVKIDRRDKWVMEESKLIVR